MKSSWICCAAASGRRRRAARPAAAVGCLVALALLVAGPPGAVAKGRKSKPEKRALEELIHPFLSPEYAGWLVGPISLLAQPAEIEAYLDLAGDPQAAEFIEEFWRRRDPEPRFPGNPLRELFEARSEEADRRFGEALVPGRRTDRGTLFVVYGPPAEVAYEAPDRKGGAPIEIWHYAKDAEAGLDGRQPKERYHFTKQGDLTVFYVPGPRLLRRPPG